MKKIRFPHRTSAFTLIELLVVISIIAVLASLTITGTQTAMLAAKKVSARNDMMQLANAVTCYYTEYGHYPTGSSTSGTNDLTFGMTSGNYYIVNVLRCPTNWTDSNSENTRQIKFLQPKVLTGSSITDNNTKGAVNGNSGNWMDPWGVQYLLFIDGSYDDTITASAAFSDITDNPSFGVGTASVGYFMRAKQNNKTSTTLSGAVKYNENKRSILLSWQ